jgi:hypothetical protein
MMRSEVPYLGRPRRYENLDWFNVTDIGRHIDNEQVCHYQVALKVGFRLENRRSSSHRCALAATGGELSLQSRKISLAVEPGLISRS